MLNRKKGLFCVVAATALLAVETTGSVFAAEGKKESYLIGFQNGRVLQQYVEQPENAPMSASASDEMIDFSVEHTYEETTAVLANLTEEEVEQLEKDRNIAYVEKDSYVTISHHYGQNGKNGQKGRNYKNGQTVPENIDQVQAPAAHRRGVTGAGAKVAVIDTGIATHPDLQLAGGVSFVDGEDYEDQNGHGTHVAGTIAALDNDIGVVGVAPEAELYAVNVLGEEGGAETSTVIEGIEWAIENDMDVVNLSLGGGDDSRAFEEAVDAARENGILVVAASGNAGYDFIDYPARYSSVLSVGAVDSDNERADFSQYGTGLDIVAPGVDVLSTYLGGGYDELSGTSMATPAVTGAAALLRGQYPDWTVDEIEEQLLMEATSIGSNNEYGNGLLNVDAATE